MKYLSHYTQKETTKALENNGAFFAFGSKQFEEQKQPGIQYVSLHRGLICPEGNVKALLNDIKSATEKGIKQDVAENGFKKIVRREYFNYETQISMDNQHVVDRLSDYIRLFPELFTEEKILNVCQECFDDAIEQDLF